MTIVDRAPSIIKRLAGTRFAERANEISQILAGKEPLRVAMPVEMRSAVKGRDVAPNGKEYHCQMRASTECIARDGGIIPMSAWGRGGLANFNNNPVILAFHDHKQPIGISVHTAIEDSSLMEHWLFHDESEISRLMHKLYDRGFMRAASVGFMVKDFKFTDELSDDETMALQDKYGSLVLKDAYWIATKAELLETSAVPVPSDPNALSIVSHAVNNADAAGIDTSSISTILKQFAPRGRKMATPTKTEVEIAAERAETDRLEAERKAAEVKVETDRLAAEQIARDTAIIAVVEPKLEELRAMIKTFTERLTALEEKSATTVVGEPDGQRNIDIEKLEGETNEAALTRTIDALVRKKLGAPVPTAK